MKYIFFKISKSSELISETSSSLLYPTKALKLGRLFSLNQASDLFKQYYFMSQKCHFHNCEFPLLEKCPQKQKLEYNP
eukprot:snap_masked-scaffold_32-processed-gene-3.9-mRNA-1 protein AED:1.00 eAED:1.00 QI:0/0/0/0/1/1/2/0/77